MAIPWRGAPPSVRKRSPGQKLPIENDQAILGTLQLSDTARVASDHLSRNISWIIAGTEYDDFGARGLPQQTFEVAVCRDEDEPMSGGIVQDPAVADACKPIPKRTFGLRE
jgi:hypothetical protein